VVGGGAWGWQLWLCILGKASYVVCVLGVVGGEQRLKFGSEFLGAMYEGFQYIRRDGESGESGESG